MIATAMVQEIQRLLDSGTLSQRRIAKLTRVSRATVGAIAAGKRPDYAERRRERELEYERCDGPPGRCAGCGGMVYLPCRLCRVRKIKEQEQAVLRAGRQQVRRQAWQRVADALRQQAESV
jgi:hypothetical protein